MALDANSLSDALYEQVIDLFEDMEKRSKDDTEGNEYDKEEYAEKLCDIIANKVVEHIVDNGDVEVDIPVAGTLETFTTGSGSNGGSLSGTGYNGFQVLINGSVKLGSTSSSGYEGKATIT